MKAFRVYFECKNCGYKWKEDFERGDRVEKMEKELLGVDEQ